MSKQERMAKIKALTAKEYIGPDDILIPDLAQELGVCQATVRGRMVPLVLKGLYQRVTKYDPISKQPRVVYQEIGKDNDEQAEG